MLFVLVQRTKAVPAAGLWQVVSLGWETSGNTAQGAGAPWDEEGGRGSSLGACRRPGGLRARGKDRGVASLAYTLVREVYMELPDTLDLFARGRQGQRWAPGPLTWALQGSRGSPGRAERRTRKCSLSRGGHRGARR